ncbi:immunoglobulin superfamily member 1-like isoform X1 [Heterodontus francisci]|uniref:immunoglobulin superfamily member 1-like isoform X1 n=2 Tax=Heterodontus francisci TaxID=7792 RepID=UPI00355C1995
MFAFSVVLGIVHLHLLVGQGTNYVLPKPTLSLNPPFNGFLMGEKINLTCRCQCPITRIHFYRSQDRVNQSYINHGKCESSLAFIAGHAHDGNYTCQCLVLKNNEWRYSNESDVVQIHIREEVAMPNIVTKPASDAVSIGEKLHISCKGDIRSAGGTFHLYKSNKRSPLLSHNASDAARTVTFTIDIQNKQSAGNYSCRYQTEILRKLVHSPFSTEAKITVRDALSKPTLTLNAPFRAFRTGEKITLTCRCQCPIMRIHFRRNQDRINYTDLKDGKCETSYDFIAGHGHEGNYTCQCLIAETGEWSHSKHSDPVQIYIRGQHLTAALVQLCLSILLLIVILIIIVDHFVNVIPPGGVKALDNTGSPSLRKRPTQD